MKKNPKSTGSPLGGYKVTMVEWREMHPFTVKPYATDNYYQQIANKVYAILEEHKFIPSYSIADVKYMALNLTSYFEDVVSEIGIFRSFIEEYRRKSHRQFPWYKITGEYFPDEINIEDVRFVLWLSMFACREGSVPNPENMGLTDASLKIFTLFEEEFEKAPVNDDLLNDIYDADNVENPGKLKAILMWLGSKCYLMPLMYPIRRKCKHTIDQLHDIFTPAKSNPLMASYLDDSYMCVTQTVGPLALYPKDWYVLMRKTKGYTDGNEEILKVKASPLYPFAIIKDNGKTFTLRSCRGKEYEVEKLSFSQSEVHMLKVGDVVLTMLFYYRGLWHVCGLAFNSYIHDLKTALKKLDQSANDLVNENGMLIDLADKVDQELPNNSPYGMEFNPELCRRAIEANKGSRLFYFKTMRDAFKWVNDNLVDESLGFMFNVNDYPKTEDAIALYLSENNRIMLSSAADSIHDPANPYYEKASEKTLLSLMMDDQQLPNEMCKYLVDHNFTDRFGLASIYGEEHGRKLMQDNIRFFETMVRQYPFWK